MGRATPKGRVSKSLKAKPCGESEGENFSLRLTTVPIILWVKLVNSILTNKQETDFIHLTTRPVSWLQGLV